MAKFDEKKAPMHLIPQMALLEIGHVAGFGARKYGPYDWQDGVESTRFIAAALRHINQHLMGEDLDPESGYSHLAHAAISLMMAHDILKLHGDKLDGRRKR